MRLKGMFGGVRVGDSRFFPAGVASLVACLMAPVALSHAAAGFEVIAGAGPSTKVVKEFVKFLAGEPRAQGTVFAVPEESTEHQGGIDSAGKNLFGRTGRPLDDREKASGYAEILLANLPIVFVAGAEAGVRQLTKGQVCDIYTGAITNWKQVGGNDRNIVLISREATEVLFQELKKDLPCMNQAAETKFVLKSDSHVVDMIKTMDQGKTAIGFGAMENFPEAVRLGVPGFFPGTRIGLVYKLSNTDNPIVRAAVEIANGKQWLQGLAALGFGAP